MKKPGRKWPSRMSASAGSGMHLAGLGLGVERLFVGREQHVAAGRAQLVAVAVPGARIGVEVLVRQELQAVDEDAGDRA